MFNKHLARLQLNKKKHAIDKLAEKGKKTQKLFQNTPSAEQRGNSGNCCLKLLKNVVVTKETGNDQIS